MPPLTLTRRIVLFGAASALGGCSAVSALNSAAQPLDTYDLSPAAGASAGRRTSHTLRWGDEAPLVLQSLLIRSISATGRIGYVGRSEGGPIPNSALLVRMDAFQVNVMPDGTMHATIDIALTVLDDRDQRVISTRSFEQAARTANDSPTAIVSAFQAALDQVIFLRHLTVRLRVAIKPSLCSRDIGKCKAFDLKGRN